MRLSRKPDYDAMYEHILGRAKLGLRAPLNVDLEVFAGAPVTKLMEWARRGRIRVEIWPHNWRVIRVEGYATAPAPVGKKPYRVIDGEASTPFTRFTDCGVRYANI